MLQAPPELHSKTWDSPFGRITVCCSGKGLRQVNFGSSSKKARAHTNGAVPGRQSVQADGSDASRFARQAIKELQEYSAGRRKQFTVPLDLNGTEFQMKVWKALMEIPYGETRSYLQIARRVDNPRAYRAVGMANHYNPLGIVVPCHRVIASDGSLGGYAGGLDMKMQILGMEKNHRGGT